MYTLLSSKAILWDYSEYVVELFAKKQTNTMIYYETCKVSQYPLFILFFVQVDAPFDFEIICPGETLNAHRNDRPAKAIGNHTTVAKL